ncbi:hypothetical protein AAVH_12734, partial [Aphelenchoides avenae]
MDKWGAYDTIRVKGNVCGMWLNESRHFSMALDYGGSDCGQRIRKKVHSIRTPESANPQCELNQN